ncbi:hypothetical protein [Rhodopila globiformis]|uniref:hypothetical protein n=1 Tax=Rhodopila globiformis TaxID=1071 RepID=UPI0011B0EA79|nr:hypothetical protein [Rhodopila globiformis]
MDKQPLIAATSLSTAVPDNDRDLVLHFESLGDNCEFGLVQRYAGAEPLGLFRFNFVTASSLIAGLQKRFSDLALPGQVQVAWANEWIVEEQTYGFRYHTFGGDPSADAGQVTEKQRRWLRYMAEKFIERLELNDRIFVRKGETSAGEADIRALHSALRQHGDVTLLWVCQADKEHATGTVEWLDTGLMRGWLGQFAPYDRAIDVDLVGWLRLCRKAWALRYLGDAGAYPWSCGVAEGALNFGGWSGSRIAVSELSWEVPPRSVGQHVMRHQLVSDNSDWRGMFGCLVRSALRSDSLYVASAYVWLPQNFSGDSVGILLHGRPSLYGRGADVRLRAGWQRIWVSAHLAASEPVAFPNLVLRGPAGTTIFSTEWQLETGAVPSDAPEESRANVV